MKTINIIIPTYNSATTIGATLESMQHQGDFLNKISAIYLADDYSTDNTIEIAKQTWKVSTPLLVLQGERNLGERGNVNRAIEVVKQSADWVLLLHSDDIAKPNWLEMMVSRIEACSEQVGSICSSWDNLMPDGSIQAGEDNPSQQIEVIESGNKSVRKTLLSGCWWHISGCAIRITAFEALGGFNPQLPQLGDWEWLLRCLRGGWGVEYIPRTLILYRQHQASVSSKSFQTHQDIKEFLEIIPTYTNLLNLSEMLQIYSLRMKWLFRRFIKSFITFNTQRLGSSLQVFLLLMIKSFHILNQVNVKKIFKIKL